MSNYTARKIAQKGSKRVKNGKFCKFSTFLLIFSASYAILNLSHRIKYMQKDTALRAQCILFPAVSDHEFRLNADSESEA